jgi:hypothetical protein
VVDETGDYLKNEEENDPIKLQKEAIELQREGIEMMRKAVAGKPPTRGCVIAGPSEKRLSIDFQIRKIGNGYILASQPDRRLGVGPYGDRSDELYFKTADELVKAAADLAEAFTKDEAVENAPVAGPPPFQLEPGEAI